jgi:tellurite resistance protein TehA-like permease
LIQLGNAAVSHKNFAKYGEGYFITADAAPIIRLICILVALLLVGFAVFWMCVDYFAIVEGLFYHRIHPSLFWWSSIFPVGTVVTAFAGLGAAMDSPAMKVVSVIIFTFLLVIYFINASFTIPMTLSGELLGLPKRFDLRIPHGHIHHPWTFYGKTAHAT